MKKSILRLILLSITIFSFFWNLWWIVCAEDASTTTTVTVTEKIPWVKCDPAWSESDPSTRKYKCTVSWQFWAVMDLWKWLIKYATLIAVLTWVLMLVLSWVEMSVKWDKKKAVERFKQVIMALLLLFFMWYILNSIAPWVYN